MEFLRYLRRVLVHWGSLMTGGIFIGALSVYQGVGHLVVPWVYWTITGVAIFGATFFTWRDEHRKTKEHEAKLLAIDTVPPFSPIQNIYLPALPVPATIEPPRHNVQCLGVEIEDMCVTISFQNVPIPGQPLSDFNDARLCVEYKDGLTGIDCGTIFPARWIDPSCGRNSVGITPRRAFLASFYELEGCKWKALPSVEGPSDLSYQERIDGLVLPSAWLQVKVTLVGENNISLAPIFGFLTLRDNGQASWELRDK